MNNPFSARTLKQRRDQRARMQRMRRHLDADARFRQRVYGHPWPASKAQRRAKWDALFEGVSQVVFWMLVGMVVLAYFWG